MTHKIPLDPRTFDRLLGIAWARLLVFGCVITLFSSNPFLRGADQPDESANAAPGKEASFLPRDFVWFISLEPARLFHSDLGRNLPQELKAIDPQAPQEFERLQHNWAKSFGIELADIQRLTLVLPRWRSGLMVFGTTTKPYVPSQVLKGLMPEAIEKHHRDKSYFVKGDNASKGIHFFDNHRFLFTGTDELKTYWDDAIGAKADGPFADSLKMLDKGHHAVVGLNAAEIPSEIFDQLPPALEPILPLKSCRALSLAADFGKELDLQGRLTFSTDDAKEGTAALQAGLVLARAHLAEMRNELRKGGKRDSEDGKPPPLVSLLERVEKALKSAAIERDAGRVQVHLHADISPALVLACNLEKLNQVAQGPGRAQTVNNLKQIALAMYNFHDSMGVLPADAIYDKSGKPLLSWRVAILPYLEEQKLYAEFKLDEPWDSERNKKLLARMPKVYAPLSGSTQLANATFYQVFTGPDTPFQGTRGPRLPASIPDGTSNTILIIEADKPVPWTKPEDIPYSDKKPIPKLGGLFADGFHVALADGSVRFIDRRKISETTLRHAICPHDGFPLGPDW
jgi:hypothetical protein